MAIAGRGNEIQANAYAMVVLSTVATGLRVYCRGWVIKAFAIDDWLAVIAQVCVLLCLVSSSTTSWTKWLTYDLVLICHFLCL